MQLLAWLMLLGLSVLPQSGADYAIELKIVSMENVPDGPALKAGECRLAFEIANRSWGSIDRIVVPLAATDRNGQAVLPRGIAAASNSDSGRFSSIARGETAKAPGDAVFETPCRNIAKVIIGGAVSPADCAVRMMPERADCGAIVRLAATLPATATRPLIDPQPELPATTESKPVIGYLYEQPATKNEAVQTLSAAGVWRLTVVDNKAPELTATITVPERDMTMTVRIRKNSDPDLPASHIVEVATSLPPDFPHFGIKSVPAFIMKPSQASRGQPLAGAATEVSDNLFWIALSDQPDILATNLKDLRTLEWTDIPIVYADGLKAILTFPKGKTGAKLFQEAMAAWGE